MGSASSWAASGPRRKRIFMHSKTSAREDASSAALHRIQPYSAVFASLVFARCSDYSAQEPRFRPDFLEAEQLRPNLSWYSPHPMPSRRDSSVRLIGAIYPAGIGPDGHVAFNCAGAGYFYLQTQDVPPPPPPPEGGEGGGGGGIPRRGWPTD